MFLKSENSKNTILFSDYISISIAEKLRKLLNHSFDLVCNQPESYLHRYIQSVSYESEMSEKIFWIQKIQKTQFCFLTTYPFELRKKTIKPLFWIRFRSNKKPPWSIYHIGIISIRNVRKKFEFRKFKKHNLVFSIHIRFNCGINQ